MAKKYGFLKNLALLICFLFTATFLLPAYSQAFWGTGAKFFEHILPSAVKNGGMGVKGGSSQVLAKNLGHIKPGFEAHHIIPRECANHPVLNKIGFDLDQAANGIALPGRRGLDPTLPVHHGYHSSYSAYVRRELDKIPENLPKKKIEKRVYELIGKVRNELQNNTKPLYGREGLRAWSDE